MRGLQTTSDFGEQWQSLHQVVLDGELQYLSQDDEKVLQRRGGEVTLLQAFNELTDLCVGDRADILLSKERQQIVLESCFVVAVRGLVGVFLLRFEEGTTNRGEGVTLARCMGRGCADENLLKELDGEVFGFAQVLSLRTADVISRVEVDAAPVEAGGVRLEDDEFGGVAGDALDALLNRCQAIHDATAICSDAQRKTAAGVVTVDGLCTTAWMSGLAG